MNKQPLSLIHALQLTLKNQQNVEIALQSVKQQEGSYEQSLSSYDPQLTASITRDLTDDFTSSTFQHSNNLDTSTEGSISVSQSFPTGASLSLSASDTLSNTFGYQSTSFSTSLSYTINISQPLLQSAFFYSFSNISVVNSALTLKSTKFTAIFNISQALLDTINAYWDLLRYEKGAVTAQQSLDYLDLIAKDVEKLIEQKRTNKGTLSNVHAQISRRKSDLADLHKSYLQASQQLVLKMGITDRQDFLGELITSASDSYPESAEPPFPKLDQELKEEALKKRADLLSLIVKNESAKINYESAKNKRLLNLTANASLELDSDRNRRVSIPSSLSPRNPEKEYSFSLSASYPLFNHSAKANIKQQKSIYQQQKQLAEQKKQEIITSLTNAYTALAQEQQRYEHLSESQSHTKKLMEEALLKLQGGETSHINDLMQHEEMFFEVLKKIDQAHTDYSKAIANILFATGNIIETDSNYEIIRLRGNYTTLPH
ncbi:TolC family protein [Simkania negevensis]|uniref:TolC family protein n=1 Tax=Simkania negevensis TaxID=83561 RepID=A0ABS3ARX5_9BACT|nr:TolC family protein [Simkania negevensis]